MFNRYFVFLSVAIQILITFPFQELEKDLGIKYEKVKCPGQAIPSDKIVRR